MDAAARTDFDNFNFKENDKLITNDVLREQKSLDFTPTPNAKVDKSDPRSNQHFVKFVKHRGITVKLWECSICGREFQHQYMLRRHLPGHTDERNYHCLVCGKSFRQLSTLSQHRTIHSLAKPHTCIICGKNFSRTSTLISHRKTHLDEKPFKCHVCYKGFHQKGNLRNHLFSHTNQRPYRCSLCNKGFNQQSNLTCHMKKVHPGNEKVIVKAQSPLGFIEPMVPKVPSVQSLFSMDMNNGIMVDSIKNPEMEKILQLNQVPFALLKHNGSRPVLVKIFTATIPEGKHMLVPVTAQDLINGGKLISGQNQYGASNNAVGGLIQEHLDASGAPLQHLQVPLAAFLDSYISPDGQHNITVHPPTSYVDDKSTLIDCIKVEETSSTLDEYYLYNNVPQNHDPEYIVGDIENLSNLHKLRESKTHLLNRIESVVHSSARIPSKDPVLNDVLQTVEGSGLMRAGVQFGSPQYLLDLQGPPSYATDYDCRSLELFEPLDCIETGKIMKHEMISIPSGDGTW